MVSHLRSSTSYFRQDEVKGPERIWWKNIDNHNVQMGRRLIIRWDVMKEGLEDKFLPSGYIDSFHRQLINRRQGSMTIDEYIHKFHELCI